MRGGYIMGIFFTGFNPRFLQELSINGQPVEDDEDDDVTDYTNDNDDDTDNSKNNNTEEDNDTDVNDDTTDGGEEDDEETTDYTEMSPDDEDEDQGGTTDDNTTEGGIEDDDETTDYTEMSPDDEEDGSTNGEDGGNDEDTTGGEGLGGGDESGDDTEGDTTEEEGEDDPNDISDTNLKKVESELFSNLTPEQIAIKNYELKQNYIDLYSTIISTLTRINDIPKSEENINVLKFVLDKLLDLKEMVDFNITKVYKTRTYIENNIIYQQCLSTLNAICDIISQIPNNKDAEISKQNDDEDKGVPVDTYKGNVGSDAVTIGTT